MVQQVTVHDAQSCYETCAGDARCDFWVWCNQATGCDHNHAFDGRYPYQSCTLIHLVKVRHLCTSRPGCLWVFVGCVQLAALQAVLHQPAF